MPTSSLTRLSSTGFPPTPRSAPGRHISPDPDPDVRVTATSAPAHSSAAHLADPDHNTSFTKGVFLGELREDLVFPFPEIGDEERESLRMVLDSFRAFAADTIDSHAMDAAGKFTDDVRKGMHELGMMGMNIPEEYGGFGASSMVFNRVFAEIGSHDPALAVYFGAHQSIGCKGITLFGTEEQKQRWLPGCASGETVAAFCLTEPGSGSDAQAMTTTATPNADGKSYSLTGTKIWISNAGYAGVFTVFAKVPVVIDGKPKQRVTAFIVDAKSPGISLGQPEQKMGIKASDTRTVTFDNVIVPVEDRLGEVGQGFKRPRDPQLRPARPRRRLVARRAHHHAQRAGVREPAPPVRTSHRLVRDDPAEDRRQRRRDLRLRFGVDAHRRHGGQGRHRLFA
jgi:hypothetical protein